MERNDAFDLSGISLKSLLQNAHIGVIIHRWDTSIVYANPTALKLLRLTYDQIIGKDAKDPEWHFVDESGRSLQIEEYPVCKVKRFKSPLSNEVLGLNDSSNQKITWLNVNAYHEMDKGEGFIVVTFIDITEQKNMFSFKKVLEKTDDIVVVTEADDIEPPLGPKIVYVNHAFEKLTGYSFEEVVGETPRFLQGKHTDKQVKANIKQALIDKQPIREKILNYSKSGHPYWLEMNVFPLKNKYGEVTHFAAIQRDITEMIYHAEQLERRNNDLREIKSNLQKLVEEKTQKLRIANKKLEQMAYYDPLTHLPNRRCFIDQAEKQISACTRNQYTLVTGLLDVDNFKIINDTHGHDVGDKVLQHISRQLEIIFRQEDIYGRIGGEEFAFSIVIEDGKHAKYIGERICQEIEEQPIMLANKNIHITVSIGLCINYPEEFPVTLKHAMKQADLCLYKAKHSGKNCVVTTDDDQCTPAA